MTGAKQLSFFDRYLTVWIFLAMALGLVLGRWIPALPMALSQLRVGAINVPIAVGLICMMVPPLARVQFELLPAVFADKRLLALSLLQNWVIGPVLMFALAVALLPDLPAYMTGLILIGLARCIAMVLVWNDLADGSPEYAAGLVALNSVFQLLFFSVYAWFFTGILPGWLGMANNQTAIEFSTVAQSVLLYLGVPLAIGVIGRWLAYRRRGTAWYQTVYLPRLAPLTPIALLLTIVAMFTLKGDVMWLLPMDVLRIALPLVIYFGAMFGVSFWMGRWLGADYPRTTALAFTAAGNNFELAIAVAIVAFGLNSGQALAAVVGPLVEVPALVGLVQVARWGQRHWWAPKAI
jgi:ACR3 family arsenite transporter